MGHHGAADGPGGVLWLLCSVCFLCDCHSTHQLLAHQLSTILCRNCCSLHREQSLCGCLPGWGLPDLKPPNNFASQQPLEWAKLWVCPSHRAQKSLRSFQGKKAPSKVWKKDIYVLKDSQAPAAAWNQGWSGFYLRFKKPGCGFLPGWHLILRNSTHRGLNSRAPERFLSVISGFTKWHMTNSWGITAPLSLLW